MLFYTTFFILYYIQLVITYICFSFPYFFMMKELACERECSRGEDYRLIKLTITDFNVLIVPFVLLIFSCCLYTLFTFSFDKIDEERTSHCCGVQRPWCCSVPQHWSCSWVKHSGFLYNFFLSTHLGFMILFYNFNWLLVCIIFMLNSENNVIKIKLHLYKL